MPFLGGGGALDALADVTTAGAVPGDVLVFGAGGVWAPAAAPPPGAHTHDASDVISGVFVNDRLYNLTTVSTTDATPTTIATIATTADATIQAKVFVQARRTGGVAGSAGDGGTFERSFRIKRESGVVTTSDLSSDYTSRDQSGWTLRTVIMGTSVLVQVIGAVDNDIDWDAALRTWVN